MFPFGIFPFNLLPQFSPWWPLQAKQNEKILHAMVKNHMDAYAAWAQYMSKGNPWLSAYQQMLENGPMAFPQSKKKG